MMTYGSVCSGIEAASAAWEPLGLRSAWFAEIEPFPSAVLAHRWPHIVNLGDMTQIAARVRAGEVDAPEILVGGTPCQTFSVAGARAGLADTRGQLTLAYVDLANAIDTARRDAGKQPVVTVWENVPGVLSSKDNAFGCFLGALAGEDCALEPAGGKWTDAGCVYGPQRAVAWRVLDAQYFGLAQRRRRVFVVASARNGFDPAAVLFEREGVRRDSAPCREAGQGDASGADDGVAKSSWPAAVAATLDAAFGDKQGLEDQHVNAGRPWFVPAVKAAWTRCDCCDDYWCNIHDEHVADCDCPPLEDWEVDPYGGQLPGPAVHVVHGTQDPCVSTDTAFALGRNNGGENAVLAFSCKDYGADAVELSPTLRAMGHGESHANAGGQVAVCFAENSRAEVRLEGGDGQRAGALSTGGGKPGQGIPMVAVGVSLRGRDGGVTAEIGDDVAGCLRASSGGGDKPHALVSTSRDVAQTITSNYGKQCDNSDTALGPNVAIHGHSAVRRLTPVECERLQGFPDNHTQIPWRGKPADQCPDGPRYKAIGNSKAVPVVRWIGERILKNAVDNNCDTRDTAPTTKQNPERTMSNPPKAPAEQVQQIIAGIKTLLDQRAEIIQHALDACSGLDAKIDNGLQWAVKNAVGNELVALSILGDEQATVLKGQSAGMAARLKFLEEQVADFGNAFMLTAGIDTMKAHGKVARRELKTNYNCKRDEIDAFLADNPQWLSLLQAKVSTTALRDYVESAAATYRETNGLDANAPIPDGVDLLPPGITTHSQFVFTVKAK